MSSHSCVWECGKSVAAAAASFCTSASICFCIFLEPVVIGVVHISGDKLWLRCRIKDNVGYFETSVKRLIQSARMSSFSLDVIVLLYVGVCQHGT